MVAMVEENMAEKQTTTESSHAKSVAAGESLLERYALIKQQLEKLNRRIRQRKRSARSFQEFFRDNARHLAHELEEHRQTWNQIEQNPAASERRTFLQRHLLQLHEQACELELSSLDKLIELERERHQLLLDYVQLKKVVEVFS